MHAAAARLYLTLAVLAACGSNHDDDGELGAHCYPNATCDVGLMCNNGTCVVAADAAVDAPADASTIDAPPDAFVCVPDMQEPNDSIADAYPTTVAATLSTRTMSATLCPGTDKDDYAVVITVPNQNLELLVDRPTGSIVQASILNSGGIPIQNAVVVSGMPTQLRAYVPNLPTGTYYAATNTSPNAMGANSHTVTVTVTGP